MAPMAKGCENYMNGFYSRWYDKRNNGQSDLECILAFIRSDEETLRPLRIGNETELVAAFDAISLVPIEEILNVIKTEPISGALTPADVPCFSTFDMGAHRLNELLMFEPEGLSFSDAGYQLMNSIQDGARKKYGENHSKLATIMSLVQISYEHRTALVTPTAWGQYLTKYELEQKRNILQKLLLRDLCVRTIVKEALNGPANYRNIVSFLARSTAVRRRSNVKCLVEYALTGTDYEYVLARINWECE